jgi:hypothetical protein
MSVKAVGALILLAAVFALGWYSGSLSGRLTAANRSADLALDRLGEVLAEREADQKARKKLQDTLDRLPKAEKKQRDLVRANPAGCDRPAAVADGLQDARNKANAARALPSDS